MIMNTVRTNINFSRVKTPKTEGQQKYVDALCNSKCVTVVTGPAGTGKTLFACQEAVNCYSSSNIEKIIITRPTVSVDEDLGYLPGGIDEKMSPWLEPIYGILSNYFSLYEIERMKDRNILEIMPLGYTRGRTFENSFVIADEFQNATRNQTKTLLTRIGTDTKMVLMGDMDQIDIDSNESGLVDLVYRIDDKLEHIDYVSMDDEDVQRHPAVKEVLELYSL